MNTLRYVQAVLWSFIGLGRRQDMAELVRQGSPVRLVAVGLTLAAVFVLTLVLLAVLAVRWLS